MRYFDEIARKAQELSEKNGKAESDALSIWLEAERMVMDRQAELREIMGAKEPVKRSWLDF